MNNKRSIIIFSIILLISLSAAQYQPPPQPAPTPQPAIGPQLQQQQALLAQPQNPSSQTLTDLRNTQVAGTNQTGPTSLDHEDQIDGNPAHLTTNQFTLQFMETSYYLKDVAFLTKDLGWAAGAPHWNQSEKEFRGTIIKTTDGGSSWTAQDAGIAETFNAVVFLSPDLGWVAGKNGTILHTSDGGARWTDQLANTSEIVDRNNIWAAGGLGEVVHSQDGGVTWRKQNISCGYPTCPIRCYALAFADSRRGWLAGEKLFFTIDGGDDWDRDPVNMDERNERRAAAGNKLA